MKRSDALAPLSRDHHQALAVALRLRRCDEASLDDAVHRFAGYWDVYGDRHFDMEEQLVLPALPEASPGWAEACERVRSEHADLRARGAALLEHPAVADAHELGVALERHVRFEERELFLSLEDRLDPGALSALGAAIDRAHP